MSNIDALFPGFTARWIDGPAGKLFARVGGEGPPLLLLHGFPQTHAMWHGVAPALAKTHTVVCLDLRGYGWSVAPHSEGGAAYSKRAMGEDAVAVMAALGFQQFAIAGHDRGARVAYRLALDHPGRVTNLRCSTSCRPSSSGDRLRPARFRRLIGAFWQGRNRSPRRRSGVIPSPISRG